MARWNQFCFSPDEAIHAEGGEDDVGHRPTPPDKVGVRQAETQRAWPVCSNSGGFRLARTPGATFAKPLDLEPNWPGRMVPSNHETL